MDTGTVVATHTIGAADSFIGSVQSGNGLLDPITVYNLITSEKSVVWKNFPVEYRIQKSATWQAVKYRMVLCPLNRTKVSTRATPVEIIQTPFLFQRQPSQRGFSIGKNAWFKEYRRVSTCNASDDVTDPIPLHNRNGGGDEDDVPRVPAPVRPSPETDAMLFKPSLQAGIVPVEQYFRRHFGHFRCVGNMKLHLSAGGRGAAPESRKKAIFTGRSVNAHLIGKDNRGIRRLHSVSRRWDFNRNGFLPEADHPWADNLQVYRVCAGNERVMVHQDRLKFRILSLVHVQWIDEEAPAQRGT